MENPVKITNPSENAKKRPLENGHVENSNYCKIRTIARDLRPYFIKVLKTPDFQNCVAAKEIRDQMKQMMDLYKEIMAETISITRCMNLPENRTETPETQKLREGAKAVADKVISPNISEDQQPGDARPDGTYIVGGSVAGWNFVTYPRGQAVYYGRTKETFRAENVVVTTD